VQQCREPGDRGSHVWHDPEGASGCGDEAGSAATGQSGRQRVKHPGARRGDDDQSGQQELDTHTAVLTSRLDICDSSLFGGAVVAGESGNLLLLDPLRPCAV
jgi:hypothetical protein